MDGCRVWQKNFGISRISVVLPATFDKAEEKVEGEILDIYYARDTNNISSRNISSWWPRRAVILSSVMLIHNGRRRIMTFIAWPADLAAFYVPYG